MTNAEIRTRIAEITAKGIAYANAHANEIKQRTEHQTKESENKIESILTNARYAAKKSYSIYELFRQQIQSAASTNKQYETAVSKLAAILHV